MLSRTFGARHAYHPYDPYLREQMNKKRSRLPITTYQKSSKDDKGRKDHAVQNSWYNKSKILYHLSSSPQEGICS